MSPFVQQTASLLRRIRSSSGPIAAATLLWLAGPGAAMDAAPFDADRVPQGIASSDWSSIRAAYEAGRHGAVAVDGGHKARNPGQAWNTRFDGRSFLTTPDHGDWTWGLELVSWGPAGRERNIRGTAPVRAEGARVSYLWDASLTEWYVNDGRGLEHGYTVHARPEGAGALMFTLAVRGDLCAETSGDGRGARFVSECGATALTYSGLVAFDADGRTLPASIDASHDTVVIRVDDRGARYPITVDPIAQQAYLKASNTDSGDKFGSSVAVYGSTVVVGAPEEQSNATGVDGNQASNSQPYAGAAYVFVRTSGGWFQQAYLKASNTTSYQEFGLSVAISNQTIVVGAKGESSAEGAAYVFVRNGTTWSQQAYLKASNASPGDNFGHSVSIDLDTIVVGAMAEDSGAIGVNGDQSSNSHGQSGAAYVFVRNGTAWSQQAYLKASNTDAADLFGWSVAVSGNTAVVSARHEDSASNGVNGDQASNAADASGAAYVFVRSGTTWFHQAYLKASNTNAVDQFGYSVSISGSTIVVGAPLEDSFSTGVNGNQTSNTMSSSGAAYVFVRTGSVWSQQAYLKASNTWVGDQFGTSVAISGSTVVVGSPFEDSISTGVNGNQANDDLPESGACYVFMRNGTTWAQRAYLKASTSGYLNQFGNAVAAGGNVIAVGSYWENSSSTGVNGDQSSFGASLSGAAYAFDIPDCNGNGIPDVNDIALGTSLDCNMNGIPDECDISTQCSVDANNNGIPDSCEAPPCAADLNGDGVVNGADLGMLLAAWGDCSG